MTSQNNSHNVKEHFRYWVSNGEVRLLAHGHRTCVEFYNDSKSTFQLGNMNNISGLINLGWIIGANMYFDDDCSDDAWYATYMGNKSGTISGYIVR